MKRIVLWVVVCALVFGVAATLLAPSVLGWYFEPPGGGMVMMQANTAVMWGIQRFREAQLGSVCIGALIGLVAGIRFRPRAKVAAAQPGVLAAGSAGGAGAGVAPAVQQPVGK